MKTIANLMALALLVSFTAVAEARMGQENEGVIFNRYQPEEIYQALNVEEEVMNAGFAGLSHTEKSVGGLTCAAWLLITPEAKTTFACKLDTANVNYGDIYNALDVEPVYLNPGIAGVSRKLKSVGGLSCLREVVVYPDAVPTYSCELAK